MKEYIDREAVCAEIDKGDLLVGNNAEWAKEIVHRTPTADVAEVVRCKDCKHLMFSDCYGECSKAYLGIVAPWDFCSYGERKEQEK
jgi:hypothetical protein